MFHILICVSVLLIATEVNSIPFNTSAPIIHPRLNPSNSFLTTFNYDVLSCSCSGSNTLRSNGIWVSWDTKRGSRPDNAVYGGGYPTEYVMRVQTSNIGLVVGKYSPDVKAAYFPYGGLEYSNFDNFEILRHTNYVWEGNKNNPNLWIPGGKTASGADIYICSAFHITTPSPYYPVANEIIGKLDGGRCWISYAGLEYVYDQVGSGVGLYQILKRVN